MRLIYTLVLYGAMPLVLARLLWRSRRDRDYRRRIGERFGWIGPRPRPCIWVHAVSVGEARAALPLIRRLQSRYSDTPLLVTTTTPTGSRQVRQALGRTVDHVYAPYDLPGAVARFLDRTRPCLAIIMETELWPNLFHACAARRIPLVVANARLSERSARGYQCFRGLTARTLACATAVAAQADADAARLRSLGARVTVTGNLKYDLTLPENLSDRGHDLRQPWGERPVLIAASTHQGEEEPVLAAFDTLRQRFPRLLLVLVPRHPERFDGVAGLCRRRGLGVARRSLGQPCDPRTPVYLGDTMGELLLLFAAADVAYVGGSLVPVGGHNVMEPAALGLPVLFGPWMFNFAEAETRLLEAGAARRVHGAEELAEAVGELLDDALRAGAMGRAGRAVVAANRGALQRLMELIAVHSPVPAAGSGDLGPES